MATGSLSASAYGWLKLLAPSSVTATHGTVPGRVDVFWTAVASANNYLVFRNTDGVAGTNTATYMTNVVGTSWSDTAIVAGTSYYYWVKSSNAVELSTFSSAAQGWGAWQFNVSNMVVTASVGTYTNRIQVSWTPATGAVPVIYEVWSALFNSFGSASRVGKTTNSVLTFSQTNVAAGSNYYYWIKATNYMNVSDSVAAASPGHRRFMPPANLSATRNLPTSIQISWTHVAGATDYHVYRNTSNSSNTAEWVTSVADSPYDDTDVTPGSNYWYWVLASNTVSTSAYGAGVLGFIDNQPPQPDPMTFATVPVGLSVSSIWMMATSATDSNPPVYYHFTNQTTATSTGWQTNTTWTNSGLNVNGRYGYQVQAKDSLDNETQWSATNWAYTLANAPLTPSLSANELERGITIHLNAGVTGGIYQADGNPTNTQYAIAVMTNADMTNYVGLNGQLTNEAPVWGRFVQWGGSNGVSITNIEYSLTNTFSVVACNGDGALTAFSSATNATFNPFLFLLGATQTNNGTGILMIDVNAYSPRTDDLMVRVAYGLSAAGQGAATNLAYLSGLVAEYGAPVISNAEPFQISEITMVNSENRMALAFNTQSASNRINLAGVDGNILLALKFYEAETDFQGANQWLTVRVDNKRPALILSSTASDPTRDSPIPVTATFSEGVTNFVAGDVTVTNGTVSAFSNVSDSVYTFNVTPLAVGTVSVNVSSNVAMDAFGNLNEAASPLTRSFDNVRPTVTMSSTSSDPTRFSPIPVAVTFSKAVTGFTAGDITPANGTVMNFAAVSATSYTFDLAPSGVGTVTADIGADVAFDSAGNGNSAAQQFFREYDTVQPTATLSSSSSDPTSDAPIPVIVTFSKNVTGFAIDDIVTGNGAVGNFVQESAAVYTFEVMPSAVGAVTVYIPANVAVDAAGNGNTASAQFRRSFEIAAPTGVSATKGTYVDRIRITWSSVVRATGYKIYRSSDSSSSSATILDNVAGTTYDDVTAQVGVKYYYFLKATNSGGVSAYSSGDYGYTQLGVPGNLSATKGVFPTQVRVTWTVVSGAATYEIWRSTHNDFYAAAKLTEVSGLSCDDSSARVGVPYYYWVRANSSYGFSSTFNGPDFGRRKASDYDGDGKADPFVYADALGIGYVLTSASGYPMLAFAYGGAGFIPIAGDYDADGLADPSVYHPASGTWGILMSSRLYLPNIVRLGGTGYTPVPADYDGDGKCDFAVYQESTGYWAIMLSGGGYQPVSMNNFGGPGYLPACGDFDADGKVDYGIYRVPSGFWGSLGLWAVKLSNSGGALASASFGVYGQIPVPGDYDGDGKVDPAMYQTGMDIWSVAGLWSMMMSGNAYAYDSTTLGGVNFTAVPADYDGDGLTDVAVYYETTGLWLGIMSSDGSAGYTTFGGPGFKPAPALK